MGRFIRIDHPNSENEWILPGYLRRYDQRAKPWPNDLFPHVLCMSDHPIQNTKKVLIRRCIEQECRGDVAAEKAYTSSSLAWNLWFQLAEDRDHVERFVMDLLDDETHRNQQ